MPASSRSPSLGKIHARRINDAKTIVLAFKASVGYVLCGTTLFLNDPILRLFWVIGTLFLMFFALSTLTNYTAGAPGNSPNPVPQTAR